jgi:DNA-binding MarR family transcriptional regulator
VSLNISAEQNTPSPGRGRRKLAQECVAELSSWNPREFITAFRRWHLGSLSLIHLNVLTLLEAEGPMSMSRLAEALDVSVASTTGIVDRMEKRGLVERRHDLADRRVVLVHPAERGLQVFVEIDKRRRLGLELLLKRLSDEELAGLLAGHRALRVARTEMAKAREARSGGGGPRRDTKSGEGAANGETPVPSERPSTTAEAVR